MQQVIILSPFYNDQEAFEIFSSNFAKHAYQHTEYQFYFLVVNDGSIESPVLPADVSGSIIHLNRNIGHQKAIAIGLAYAEHHLTYHKIVVMDCDGEDRIEDALKLISHSETTSQIVFAKRASRQESSKFKLFYQVYKLFFKLLTGQAIAYGNFMLLPRKEVGKLIYYSEIWNHLAGGILKSKIGFTSVPTHRGKRYKGKSKMSFNSLLLHGLSAVSIFIDVIASRLLIFSIAMIVVSLLAIVAVLTLKFGTNLAIPGWTTTAVSSLLIVMLQSFLLSLFTVFLYLSAQAQRKFIPAHHYMDFVRSIENTHNATPIPISR